MRPEASHLLFGRGVRRGYWNVPSRCPHQGCQVCWPLSAPSWAPPCRSRAGWPSRGFPPSLDPPAPRWRASRGGSREAGLPPKGRRPRSQPRARPGACAAAPTHIPRVTAQALLPDFLPGAALESSAHRTCTLGCDRSKRERFHEHSPHGPRPGTSVSAPCLGELTESIPLGHRPQHRAAGRPGAPVRLLRSAWCFLEFASIVTTSRLCTRGVQAAQLPSAGEREARPSRWGLLCSETVSSATRVAPGGVCFGTRGLIRDFCLY